MVYNFSKYDIGFLSLIFHHPLPLIVDDPFNDRTKVQIQNEWQLFTESFRSKGLLRTDVLGNVILDTSLIESLVSMFGADTMISIIQEEEIQSVFYLHGEDRSLLKKEDIGFSLKHFEGEEDFSHDFLANMSMEMAASPPPFEYFSLQLPTSQFDTLLGWYNNSEIAKISDLCTIKQVSFETCISLLNSAHQHEGLSVLTERIGGTGTIITKIVNDSGILTLVKMIYTEEKEMTALLQCPPNKLIKTILAF
ncbi:hypothetical protein RCG19_06710 [Neobacillus sp. OS1-2]|uniref:hypothetical protein n=1 Tax=Neobacillus sp. OS1-2 TaxID=3070680 RepID=UPI0027E1C45F|nr:hypothetical protein [Neobacillus sp. OS1-2]WML41340.1 hypothetical protein RCG19_06710 [Neobacillus sp. OS1-2]